MSAEKFIFIDFLLLKLTNMTSNQEYVNMKTSAQIPGLTSLPLTLTAKKSSKIKFSADFTRYITIFLMSIQRFQICKTPKPRIGTLMAFHPTIKYMTRPSQIMINTVN